MDKTTIINTIISFAISLPVWAIVGFLLSRMVKNRDDFEKGFEKTLSNLNRSVADFNRKLTVVEKDLEYAHLITKTVSDMVERTSKNQHDLNNLYAKLRDSQAYAEKLEKLLRERTHWTNGCFSVLGSTMVKLHGAKGEMKFEKMPT